MKYTVYTYCTIPDGVELTERRNWVFKYRNYVPNGVTAHTFDSWEALLYFVKEFDSIDWHRKPTNKFLDATMCSPNDSRRHRIDFDGNESRWSIGDAFYLGYLVKNDSGKIVDLRNYVKELNAFNKEAHRPNSSDWQHKWDEREARWERARKLYEGKSYWRCYRQIQTTAERRAACNEDSKGLIRGKRSIANLPNSWDDLHFRREKTWKARTKVKHQWEVNIVQHIDSITSNPDYDWDEEVFEED